MLTQPLLRLDVTQREPREDAQEIVVFALGHGREVDHDEREGRALDREVAARRLGERDAQLRELVAQRHVDRGHREEQRELVNGEALGAIAIVRALASLMLREPEHSVRDEAKEVAPLEGPHDALELQQRHHDDEAPQTAKGRARVSGVVLGVGPHLDHVVDA